MPPAILQPVQPAPRPITNRALTRQLLGVSQSSELPSPSPHAGTPAAAAMIYSPSLASQTDSATPDREEAAQEAARLRRGLGTQRRSFTASPRW